MRRTLAGALAVGVVGVGSAFLAGPGGAQEAEFDVVEHLDANLTPTVVNAGQTVTVTSVDPCPQPPEVEAPTDELAWAFGPAGWLDPNDPTVQPGELTAEGTVPVAEDGTWEVTFPAPATSGAYDFFAICLAADMAEGEGVEDVVEDAVEEAEAATLGDDHDGDEHGGTSSTTPSTEPPPSSTEPTQPPPTEPPTQTAIYLYGPETFTVQGAPAPAVPVRGEPEFTG